VFCARCGQQIPDASVICPQCGLGASLNLTPATSGPVQATILATEQISTPPAPNFMPATTIQPKQKEVGGWLMFFCILLIVVVPVAVMVMAWSGDFGIEVLFNIAWAAFGVLVGAMLWNVHSRAFLLLWIYFAMAALIIVMAVVNLATAEEGVTAHDSILVFRSIIYCTTWFLYFKRSDRVRATFGRNL
jgi:Protein of unknown function (DUF2569)